MNLTKAKYYNNYQEIYRRSPHYFDPIVEKVLPFVSSTQRPLRVLDIGCGFGDLLISFQKFWRKKIDSWGITLAAHEVTEVKKKKLPIHIQKLAQQQLKDIKTKKQFDVIFNFHTLSYITQSEQNEVLHSMMEKLFVGGILVLALMEDRILLSTGIQQEGVGYSQFWYSPLIFIVLGKLSILRASWQEPENGYRIQIWEKTDQNSFYNQMVGWLLAGYYVVRNQILCFPQLKKITSFVYKLLP